MDPAFITYLRHQRLIVDYMNISALALLIYDYILTLHLEIKYIWLSRWNYTKVLFFLTRYMVVAEMLVAYSETFVDISAEACRITWPVKPVLVFLGALAAETILCIRTWAVWNRNKVVGVVLAATMLANFVVQCPLLVKFISSCHFAFPPYVGFRGCFILRVSKVFWGEFAAQLVVQAVIFTLMIISAFRLYKQGYNTELMFMIHKDGILFYVYLLFLTGVNMLMALTAPLDISSLFIPLEEVLDSLLTTRILLNIRSMGSRGHENEFHTSYFDASWRVTPFQFMSNDGVQDRTIDGGT